jgi:hypothetical protein
MPEWNSASELGEVLRCMLLQAVCNGRHYFATFADARLGEGS